MNLHLDADYLFFDGVEAVTLRSRQANNAFVDRFVEHALRRSVTKTDRIAAGGALVSERETVFHLPQNECGATVPKVSDVVLDADGAKWSVRQVEVHTQTERFRCSVIREVGA